MLILEDAQGDGDELAPRCPKGGPRGLATLEKALIASTQVRRRLEGDYRRPEGSPAWERRGGR